MVLTDDEGNVLYDQNNIFKPKTSGSEALKVSALGSVMKAEETSKEGYISQKKVMQVLTQVIFFFQKTRTSFLCQ